MEQVSQVGCISKFPFARKKTINDLQQKKFNDFSNYGIVVVVCFFNFNEFTKCVVVDNVCSCDFLVVCFVFVGKVGTKKKRNF